MVKRQAAPPPAEELPPTPPAGDGDGDGGDETEPMTRGELQEIVDAAVKAATTPVTDPPPKADPPAKGGNLRDDEAEMRRRVETEVERVRLADQVVALGKKIEDVVPKELPPRKIKFLERVFWH